MKEAWYICQVVKTERGDFMPSPFTVAESPGGGGASYGVEAKVGKVVIARMLATDAEHLAIQALPNVREIAPANVLSEGQLIDPSFAPEKLAKFNTGRRGPRGTWTDDFNRSDEDLEDSSDWTRLDGAPNSASVSTNKLQFPYATVKYQAVNASVPNGQAMYAQLDFSDADDKSGPCVRMSSKTAWYGADIDTGYATHRVELRKGDESVITFWNEENQTWPLELKIDIDDNDDISVYVDDVALIDGQNDTSHSADGRCGVFHLAATAGTETGDNFECGPLAVSGPTIPIIMHHRKMMGVS